MRILLLTHAFNSLTQRLYVELAERGHQVDVEFDVSDAVTIDAVRLSQPDLIVAPFLKRAIPEAVWSHHVCLVVHPGIEGDRGPSALDWAILEGRSEWGVTVLQANGEFDAGPVWESRGFAMPEASKSSIYRHQVTEAAVDAVLACVERFPDARSRPPIPGRLRPLARQEDRRIDWRRDSTACVLRKIRSGDGNPGVRDEILGLPVFLFDASKAELEGVPGSVIARSNGAVAVATVDGAVWIGHLRAQGGIKLPAERVLGQRAAGLPEQAGYDDIAYEERGAVGILRFPFHNGAMSSGQCRRLLAAYERAIARPTTVLVLAGGPDYWSNGIHLNVIEAAASPADESWSNINAIDDIAKAVIETTSHVTVAALAGNAGAGGVFLALAADEVWARPGVVLNPHYKGMGNLYGSEYWTYTLPRRAGGAAAQRVTEARLPVGTKEALRLGLIDRVTENFLDDAAALAGDASLPERLRRKRDRRRRDEATKPLAEYRAEELALMRLNFYGFDPSYHVARYNFVHKIAKSRTPLHWASHRRKKAPS
jgi:putative two-component system hydrogenase maturation factor HypX/HoxX